MNKRRRTLVKDTPEKSGIDVTIVEDSVFDTSQVSEISANIIVSSNSHFLRFQTRLKGPGLF